MAETATEEKKEKAGAFSGMLYTATVTAEGAGAVCEEEAKVDITDAGIRINLFRIALINRNSQFAPLMFEGVGQNDFSALAPPEGAPEIPTDFSSYTYASTGIREGYLYVINEADENGFSEWLIGFGGQLTEVDISDLSLDERDVKEGGLKINQYIAQPTDILWFAYSEIQWSAAYFESLRTDQPKREARMQQYNLVKHTNNEEQECSETSDLIKNSTVFVQEQIGELGIYNNSLKIEPADEQVNNELGYKQHANLCLNDSVGIIREISLHLTYQWTKMDALIMSLKIGVDSKKVYNALRTGVDPKSLQSKENLKQIDALFNMAITLKSVAFSNEDNIKKIGKKIDAERLNNLLAPQERTELKNKIKLTRDFFADFLDCNHYATIENDYKENTQERKSDAKKVKAELVKELVQLPNFKDSFLESEQERNQWTTVNDKGTNTIKKALKGENTIGKIFNEPTVLESAESTAVLTKVFAVVNALFDVAKGMITEGDEIADIWKDTINKNKIKTDKYFDGIEDIYEYTTVKDAQRNSNKHSYVDKVLNVNVKTKRLFNDAYSELGEEISDFVYAKQLTFTKAFQEASSKEFLEKASAFQNGVFWKKTLRNVSFLNLAFATTGMRKFDDKFQFALNVAKLTSALGEAYIAIEYVKLTRRNLDEAGEIVLKGFAKRTSVRLAYAGPAIDVAEAGYNFWQRDYDAALAYSGSAAMGVAALFLISGTANGWNPAGWLMVLGGIGLGVYASFLEDTPLETIAKNGVFQKIELNKSVYILGGFGVAANYFYKKYKGNEDALKQKENYTAQINAHVALENREALHDDLGFSKWIDYTEQHKDLMDILGGGVLKVVIDDTFHLKDRDDSLQGGFSATILHEYHRVTKINISISFGTYLTNPDILDYKIIHLKKGLGTASADVTKQLKVPNDKIKIIKEKDKAPRAEFTVYLNSLSATDDKEEILILARIKMSGDQYFPIRSNNENRYLASRIPLIEFRQGSMSPGIMTNQDKRMVVGTEKELNSKEKWKKTFLGMTLE